MKFSKHHWAFEIMQNREEFGYEHGEFIDAFKIMEKMIVELREKE